MQTIAIQRKKEPVIGKHLYANLYGIDSALISNLKFITDIVINAASLGKMHILKVIKKKFNVKGSKENGGVSVIALIVESHISIHTWPENSYATVDIYSCGNDADPEVAFSYMLEVLHPKRYKKYMANRSEDSI